METRKQSRANWSGGRQLRKLRLVHLPECTAAEKEEGLPRLIRNISKIYC